MTKQKKKLNIPNDLILKSMSLPKEDMEYCLYLLNKIKYSKDFGEQDMTLCQLENFIKERTNE